MAEGLEAIPNFIQINDRLGSAGMPAREQLQSVRDAGYEVVINLAMGDSPGAIENEGEAVRALGMDYIHIPVVWGMPRLRDLEDFFNAMEALRGRRVFVHCAMNMRVSAFLYLYRLVKEGLPEEEARRPMDEIWDPAEYPVWDEFIRQAKLRHLPG